MDVDRYATAGPWARLTLPDGQSLDVLVTARTRASDGWWYELEVILPTRLVLGDGSSRLEPAPVACSAPAHLVTPIDGQDYSALPTTGEAVDPGLPWVVQRVTHPHPNGPTRLLHRPDCWIPPSGSVDPVSAEDALGVLADEEGAPCDVCKPELVLQRR